RLKWTRRRASKTGIPTQSVGTRNDGDCPMHLRPHIAPALAIDEAARTVTAVITSAAPDRAGDVVVPAGLENAEGILLNPVVLWAHQRAMPPIGTCLSLDVQPA